MSEIIELGPLAREGDAETGDKLFFAQVREDPTVELAAFAPVLGGRLAVVSSGGCTALSLLGAGAGEVHSVDLNSTQNDIVDLKAASLSVLPRDEALGFLGARVMSRSERARVYMRLRSHLTPRARATWDARYRDVEGGVLHAGITEKFLRKVMGLIRRGVVRPSTFRRILDAPDLPTQQRIFDEEWDNARWHALLSVMCHRRVFDSVYDEAFFASTGKTSFADHFAGVVGTGLRSLPAGTNWFAHDLLAGRYGEALPPYLTEAGARGVRGGRTRLHLHDRGMESWLATQGDASVDGVALSNICEWFDEAGVRDLFAELARTLAPAGVVVLRNFVGWTALPAAAEGCFELDEQLSEQLSSADRSLMQYRVVVLRRTGLRSPARVVTLREMRVEDTPALAALLRANPIQAATQYVVDRSPNFRALHDLFPGSSAIAAEGSGGEIVGAVAVLAHRGRVGEEVVPTRYAGGLVRRAGVGYAGLGTRLVTEVVERFHASDAHVLTWLTNDDNAPMGRLASRSAPPGTVSLGRVEYTEVLPLRASSLPRGWTCTRGGSDEEVAAALSMFDQHYAEHSLYAPLVATELGAPLPGSSREDLRLLRDPEGHLVAAALVWDPSPLVRVVPIRLDRLSRSWERAVRTLRRAHVPLPEPPREGEPVRTLHVRRAAWSTPQAGTLLMAALGSEVVERRFHTLSYVTDVRTPLPRAHRLVFTYPGQVSALVASHAALTPAELAARPVFLDTSLA